MAEKFHKILIANRGEIALRVIRACREMDIASVVVYSQADADSLPVRLADEAVCIGPGKASQSYLLIERILSVAALCDVSAIHPGYGFLSENPYFAEACEKHGITFIGPSADVMRALGDKAMARATMKAAGVPVTPGIDGTLKDENDALVQAQKLQYPVIIKAVAGGGGRGMRIVHNAASLLSAYHSAKSEAESAFGNSDLYMEKFLVNPRHIEVQIMADKHGNVVHLGERDCSVQRRNQKLVEESPSPGLSDKLREKICLAAVKAAKASKYVGAGTIEFLCDNRGNFYFMEMNTRIQVEHPVSELVSGIDLVKEQIRVAAGEHLSCRQRDIKLKGHAIEYRVNAEDPDHNFAPMPGVITGFVAPGGPGVRVDSHVYSGYHLPPFYDSLLAKIIVKGDTREEALQIARRALHETLVEGVKTTVPFLKKVMRNKSFTSGKYDTGLVENILMTTAKQEKN